MEFDESGMHVPKIRSMSGTLRDKYPVGEIYEVLDGFDIHRTSQQIIAIVVIHNMKKNRNDIRFYRWFNRYGKWKIPSMGISVLDHPSIFTPDVINRISKLKEKYNVSERYPKDEKNDFESKSLPDEDPENDDDVDEYGLYKF